MTVVINILGGAGVGKSTCAAALFAEMKQRGIHVELVQEWVKQWAWEERKIGEFDQLYIFAKQARREAQLYDKVDFIVTDSPVLLSAFYEFIYTDNRIISQALPEYMTVARKNRVQHFNFLLSRCKNYDPRGRYQTEKEAVALDESLRKWLVSNQYSFDNITSGDRDRPNKILEILAKEQEST